MSENINNPEFAASTQQSIEQLRRNIDALFDLHKDDTHTTNGGAEDDGTKVFGEQLLLFSTSPEGVRTRLLLSRDPVPGSQNSAIKIEYKDLEDLSRGKNQNVVCRYVVILHNGELEETYGHWDMKTNKNRYSSHRLNDAEVAALNARLIASDIASEEEINRFIGLDVKTAGLEHAYLLDEDDKAPSRIRRFAKRIIKLTGM